MTPEDARRRAIAVWMIALGAAAIASAFGATAAAFTTGDLLPWLLVAGALLLVGVPLWVAETKRKREFGY